MSRRSPNLALTLPRCRSCNRHWHPQQGVSATRHFCKKCSPARRAAAEVKLDLKPLEPSDFDGPYLLPRKLRRYQPAK